VRNDADYLTAAVVQLEIEPEVATDEAMLCSAVTEIVEDVMEETESDLIVFPEYTNVFLALDPYYEQIRAAASFTEGFEKIKRAHPEIETISGLFKRQDDTVERMMDRIWGGLAAEFDVTIVAGSYFAAEPPSLKKADRTGELLKNRAVVYGPRGTVIYTQDKVFLTEFEREVVGLSAGTVEEAGFFYVEGEEVVLTLCRDTFFEVWEDKHAGAYLWFDLKANGTDFDREEKDRFKTALPERLASADVPFGATVCLTGSFLDLFWEGESSVIARFGERHVDTLAVSSTVDGEDILVYSFPLAKTSPSGEAPSPGTVK